MTPCTVYTFDQAAKIILAHPKWKIIWKVQYLEQERPTTIALTIAGRAITIKRLMLRRSVKQCKTDKKLVKESKSDTCMETKKNIIW